MLINMLLRRLEYLQSVPLVDVVDVFQVPQIDVDMSPVLPDTPPPHDDPPYDDPTFNRNENESLTNEPCGTPTEPAGCFSSLNTGDDVGI